MCIARNPLWSTKLGLLIFIVAAQAASTVRSQTYDALPIVPRIDCTLCISRARQEFSIIQSRFNQKQHLHCPCGQADPIGRILAVLVDADTATFEKASFGTSAIQQCMCERSFERKTWVGGTLPVTNLPLLLPAKFPSEPQASPQLKWVGLGAFWWAAFFDHYQDAIQDAGGRKTHLFGANIQHWHFVKTLAHLGYLAAGVTAGIELGQKRVALKHFAWRTAGAIMIYWFIQNIVYDKALNNVWLDYDRRYATDSIVIFDLTGKDHRIELSKWSRPMLDIVRVALGSYLVVKY